MNNTMLDLKRLGNLIKVSHLLRLESMPHNIIKNIFTIDLEDWYHANYEESLFENDRLKKSTVCDNTQVLLDLFDEHGVHATFFVLGFVADQHPDLIKKIMNYGHEIASHGYGHKLIYSQTPDEFKDDIHKAKGVLEDLTGSLVLGYRAPSWSITKKSLWALDILIDEGFQYDSSIFPTENFLYGIGDAPRFINKPVIGGIKKNIWEIPPSTARIAGKNIPFSGGFYFRACPLYGIKLLSNMVKREDQSVVYYLHPREIDPKQPRLRLSKKDALIHYFGIKGCQNKLEDVVKKNDFVTIQQYLESI